MATKRNPPAKEEATKKAQDIILAGWARKMLSKRDYEDRVKQVEDAVCRWYATARSRLEEDLYMTENMAKRIEKEPGCLLADFLTADELRDFAGPLSDVISRLQDIYPLVGERLTNPAEVMGKGVTEGHCATA